jgi:tetrahydrodipicolinate N-succinyltransferase
VEKQPVIIEDNVWIGPMAAIFKGVRVWFSEPVDPASVDQTVAMLTGSEVR